MNKLITCENYKGFTQLGELSIIQIFMFIVEKFNTDTNVQYSETN